MECDRAGHDDDDGVVVVAVGYISRFFVFVLPVLGRRPFSQIDTDTRKQNNNYVFASVRGRKKITVLA